MRRIRTYLVTVAVIAFTAGYALRVLLPGEKTDVKAYLREIAPGINFLEKKTSPPYYPSDKGTIAFNTYEVMPSVRGYAGPIKILVALSPEGRITGLRILEHKETKNYVHYMETPDYLRQFLGKSINEPFRIDSDIEGISRATVSVEALARTIRDSSRMIASDVLGIDVKVEAAGMTMGTGWLLYLLMFSAAFTFYFITRKTRRLHRVRDISLIASILIIGLHLSSPFSIIHAFNLALLRPSSSIQWYVIILSTAASIIIAGRFYCGWLCPFGAMCEFISRLPFRKWDISVEMDDRWRNLKYIMLGIAIILVFVSRKAEFGNYETYVTLFSFHGNYLSWTLVVLMLLSNLRVARFWCRYMCPVSALTGLFSRKDSGYVSRHDCPIGNKPMPLISECIRCNRCYKGGE